MKKEKDISVEAAQEILKKSFDAKLKKCSEEIDAVLKKHGLEIQVTQPQIILVPRKG